MIDTLIVSCYKIFIIKWPPGFLRSPRYVISTHQANTWTKWSQENYILRELRIQLSFFSILCNQMHTIAGWFDNSETISISIYFCLSSHIKMSPHNSPQITVWWCPIHHWLIWPKIAKMAPPPFLAPSHIKMMQCTITHMIDRCYSTSFVARFGYFHVISLVCESMQKIFWNFLWSLLSRSHLLFRFNSTYQTTELHRPLFIMRRAVTKLIWKQKEFWRMV